MKLLKYLLLNHIKSLLYLLDIALRIIQKYSKIKLMPSAACQYTYISFILTSLKKKICYLQLCLAHICVFGTMTLLQIAAQPAMAVSLITKYSSNCEQPFSLNYILMDLAVVYIDFLCGLEPKLFTTSL